MKTQLGVISCLVLLIGLHGGQAQVAKGKAGASATKPQEFADLISAIPKKDLLKLRGNTQADAAKAISKKIGAAVLNKEGTFRVTVESVDVWPYPEEGLTGWRVKCKNEPIKESAVTLDLMGWIYVRNDPDKVLEKMRAGRDLVVTGQVTRAEITAVDNKPMLHIDVQVGSLTKAK